MIFVTVGGSTRPFPRLTQALSALPLDELVVQHGPSAVPDGVAHAVPFMDFAEVLDHLQRADVVVSHAGSGSVICARRNGHTPVLVPRLARYDETVDDHQAEFAAALEEAGEAIVVWDVERLAEAVSAVPRRVTPRETTEWRSGTLHEAVRRAIHGQAPVPG
ncbi:MAG TPA: glycosyltransferase [Gaiellaceae bacterium]|nr:glycosyltransferase [Gaiellaceae bacterium]